MLKRLWKRLDLMLCRVECMMFGHDLETKKYTLWFTKGCEEVTVLQCNHCQKVFFKE